MPILHGKYRRIGQGFQPVLKTPQAIQKAEVKAEKQEEKRDEEKLKVDRKKLFQAWTRF